MKVIVKKGDVLDEKADVLICTANPMLRMSGGVNGAILERGGKSIQHELQNYLKKQNCKWVPSGSVIQTSAGPIDVKYILHAVAIDGFYQSSILLVKDTIIKAFKMADKLHARYVAMPSLATGYGPLSIQEFSNALKESIDSYNANIEQVTVVLRKDVAEARQILLGKTDE